MFDDSRLMAWLAPALLVLGGALLARFGRLPAGYAAVLGAAALPLALLLGFALLLGSLQASPRQLGERLPMLALLLLGPALLAARWPWPRLGWPLLGCAALLTGWWMGGGTLHGADLWRALPASAGVAAGAALAGLAWRGPWQGVVLAPGLALLLHLAAPPGPWADLALVLAVVAVAAAAFGAAPPMAGWLALGPAMAALVAGPVLALGRGTDWAVAAALLLAGGLGAAPWPGWGRAAAQAGFLGLAAALLAWW